MDLEFLSKFEINTKLYNYIESYFKEIYRRHPDKINMIEKDNVSMLTCDELIIDWIFKKGYFNLRIRESEIRCEAKFADGSRFGKFHHVPNKMILVLEECLNRLIKENNG